MKQLSAFFNSVHSHKIFSMALQIIYESVTEAQIRQDASFKCLVYHRRFVECKYWGWKSTMYFHRRDFRTWN